MAEPLLSDLRAVRADTSLRGSEFCFKLAGATDRWLKELFDVAVAGANGAGSRGLSLVAVGGYGRSELCPGSDVDVVLLHAGKRDRSQLSSLAEAIWYPVWDAGVKLGHAVRSVKEALSLAADDLDTATALLDVRLVAGDPELAAELAQRASAQWRARASRWLDGLGRSVAERHQRAGEVAFLLEPDLKEGRGGLRDVHALRWAEAARTILLDEDHRALSEAYEDLLGARVELQRRTGKPTDRLLLQDQDGVASALGDTDADALMRRIAQSARTIAWTSDDTWQRIDAALRGPKGRQAGADRRVAAGLVLREGVVELEPGVEPSADATLVLRAAAVAALHGTRIGRDTLARLAAEGAVPSEPWPDEARRALLRLLGAGRAAIPVLEALDQKGLLARLVPEWEAVRSLPQRNAYHRFTVDRHLCEAAAEAASLAGKVHRPDLLLLGAWLHDIGKGFTADVASGDHTEAGIPVVERLARRMGFPPEDVDVLADLVRHHLLLPDAATRRDLQDPVTIASVAEAAKDTGTLELLHALTEADSLATGPSAWSPWKAGLVTELVGRTAKELAGEAHTAAADDFPSPEQKALIDEVQSGVDLVLEGRGSCLSLAAPDRRGLFFRVAGTLALHNLDVLDARVWSSDEGIAVEDFRVETLFGGEPDWALVEADLRRVLAGRLSLEARLAERARVYGATPRAPRAAVAVASATPARTYVVVDNEASATATVVDVRAPDRMGTLYRITRALAELELDVRHAKVASLGHEAVDAFYVVDADGAKVTDPDHMREVERAILVELERA